MNERPLNEDNNTKWIQCCILTFSGDTVFLKLYVHGLATPKKFPVESPKTFDIRCLLGNIFIYLAKIIVSEVFVDYFVYFSHQVCIGKMLKCFLLGALPKQVRHCGYNWSESLRWRPLLFEPLKRSFFLTSVKFHSSISISKIMELRYKKGCQRRFTRCNLA